MVGKNETNTGKMDMLRVWLHPRVLTMLFLGFSAGIPILLIFSTLSVWLREAGVSRSAVTFFSWAALGYSFKFIWAPLVDKFPLPFLSKLLGRRRSWMLFSQLSVITAIAWMGFTDPTQGDNGLVVMAMAAVFLGFSSATQDIVLMLIGLNVRLNLYRPCSPPPMWPAIVLVCWLQVQDHCILLPGLEPPVIFMM